MSVDEKRDAMTEWQRRWDIFIHQKYQEYVTLASVSVPSQHPENEEGYIVLQSTCQSDRVDSSFNHESQNCDYTTSLHQMALTSTVDGNRFSTKKS